MSRHLPEHNQVLLTYTFLHQVLDDLSDRLLQYFGRTVRLVIHGGAVMVLHANLRCRQNTRDVDYLHRSFEAEWKARGVADAGVRLNACIAATAERFGLGLDWMNAHADVALPMAYNQYSQLYDPIYTDAVTPTNMALNTVYKSHGLQLIGVSWSWAVALKLVRYQKDDPQDIAAILKYGSQLRGLQWTRQIMEDWLLNMCSPMGYAQYPMDQIEQTRQKMRDAVHRAQALAWPSQPPPSVAIVQPGMILERPTTTHPTMLGHPSAHNPHGHLRHRTKSFSNIASRTSRPLVATSSMPSLPVSHASSHMTMPAVHASAQSSTVSSIPPMQLPPGFVPYHVSAPPINHFVGQHSGLSQRLRIQT